MRTKVVVFVFLLALGIAVAATVTGQEEPLPTVQSRAFAVEPASIILAVEPIRTVQQPTLADAVRRNDYVTFHALYQESQPAEYRTLHELWTWAMSDPTGAFYGRDTHDRLARAYPGYASYIEAFRIVDSRGNVFYPTSETRTFLLQRAMEREAPRVQLATTSAIAPKANVAKTTTRKTVTHATAPKTTTHATVTKNGRSSASPESRRSARRAAPKAAVTAAQKTAPATVAPKTTATTTPTTAVTTPNGAGASPATTSAAATPAVTTPIATAPATVETTPVATTSAEPVATTPAQPVPAKPADAAARTPNSGILLLVIGLIGVGLLAVILRTPREAQPTSILQPPAPPANTAAKPAASVEPIRRPADEKPRATGSHG